MYQKRYTMEKFIRLVCSNSFTPRYSNIIHALNPHTVGVKNIKEIEECLKAKISLPLRLQKIIKEQISTSEQRILKHKKAKSVGLQGLRGFNVSFEKNKITDLKKFLK
jgi:hypothetical protein